MDKFIVSILLAFSLIGCASSVMPQADVDGSSMQDAAVTETVRSPELEIEVDESVEPQERLAGASGLVILNRVRYRATRRSIEIREIPFNLSGQSSTSCPLIGSRGTRYFAQLRMRDTPVRTPPDMFAWRVMAGPLELNGLAQAETQSGPLAFHDALVLEPGMTYHFEFIVDTAYIEDAVGEFTTRDCQYRVEFGARRGSGYVPLIAQFSDTGLPVEPSAIRLRVGATEGGPFPWVTLRAIAR